MQAFPFAAAGPPFSRQSLARVLIYSHDTFGLGHLRRSRAIANALVSERPGVSVLIISGSPVIGNFEFGSGVDYVRIPGVTKLPDGDYRSLNLNVSIDDATELRETIILQTAESFRPDLFIDDKEPTGFRGEIVPALERLQQHGCRLVLGIRDVMDEPALLATEWERKGAVEALRRYYDEVWVYGVETLFDAVREYGFPQPVADKTFFCGYLKRPVAEVPPGHGAVRVLVTTGGGGDGSELIGCYLEGLVGLPRRLAIHTTVVFGPQMSNGCRAALRARYDYLRDVTFLDFEPDLTRRYAEADVVVSMAGYNTVCELLSMRRRAVLVPRAEPVREQLIRARLFAGLGYFDVLEPQDLSAAALIGKVLDVAARPPLREAPVDMDGLPRIRARVRALLGTAS